MVAIVVICNLTNFYVTQVLRHLHISHNAPYLPPKSWHNLCFSFLLNITAAPREIENNACAKFWGANNMHYMGGVQGHIKRNSKLNLMFFFWQVTFAFRTCAECMLNDQLIFNIS